MQTFNDVEESANGKSGRRKSDVAILGVPFDAGTSYHTGQRLAPYAIRQEGFWQDSMEHLQTGVDPMELLTVVDCGDLAFTPGEAPDKSWAYIKEQANAIWQNTRCLLSIGGDHSATAKLIEGIVAADGHPVTVFHFDAHTDYDRHDPGVSMNHGTWVRRVLDDGAANRIVQFGVRGWGVKPADRKWAEKNDVVTYYAQDNKMIQNLVAELNDTSDSIYLSIDIDVLDPSFAPGVAYREPGGLTVRELFGAIGIITGSGKVIGADVMEVIPDRDPSGLTTKVANRAVAQILTGLAAVKKP